MTIMIAGGLLLTLVQLWLIFRGQGGGKHMNTLDCDIELRCIAGDNTGRRDAAQAGLRRTPISVVFTDRQIAMVGMNYESLLKRWGSCDCFAVGEVPFSDQGRSLLEQ